MTSPDLDTYRQRANRRSRRRLVVSAVLIPVVVLLGGVVAGLSTQPPLKMRVLVLVGGFSTATYLLGLFAVLGFTRWHTGRWSTEQPAIAGASRRTRRRVVRDVGRGNLPSDEPDRFLAIDHARALVRQRWAHWVLGIVGVLLLFYAPYQESTTDGLWCVLTACIFIAGAVLTVVQRRGALAMLAHFDEEQTHKVGHGI